MSELVYLGNKYKSDKQIAHEYMIIYEKYFDSIKNDSLKILEMGVKKGQSLKIWKEYFKNSTIYGFDFGWPEIGITKYIDQFSNDPKIKIFIGNQEKREDLKKFINKYNESFDIIIDDSGHSMIGQQQSLGFLFKYLNTGGLYIIEDLGTSLGNKSSYKINSERSNTTLEVLEKFKKNNRVVSSYMLKSEIEYLNENLIFGELTYAKRSGIICFLRKKIDE
tara:strand:+ start:2639 stop:3301 length:663 start_codon:yes stop_codon:yes gene_type:complete